MRNFSIVAVLLISLLLAPIFSLMSTKGTLASVYAVRAIISTSLLLILMTRAEMRSRRT